MRLIDADKLIENKFKNPISYAAFCNLVKRQMTVDAVPVVRCTDCIWMQCNAKPDETLPKGVDEYECRHWCGACDPTDFCSYGERKDGDEHEAD